MLPWDMDMLAAVLPYLLGVALAATVVVLFAGVVAMNRGGKFNARYGNKLMRARVILQGVAIALLTLFVLVSRG